MGSVIWHQSCMRAWQSGPQRDPCLLSIAIPFHVLIWFQNTFQSKCVIDSCIPSCLEKQVGIRSKGLLMCTVSLFTTG